MSRRLTHMERAERWYRQQVKNGRLRDADYIQLSKHSAICYEPAENLSVTRAKTLHDILSDIKVIDNALKLKL